MVRNSSSENIQKLVNAMEQQEQDEQQGEQSAEQFAQHLRERKSG